MQLWNSIVAQVGSGREVVATFSIVGFRLELVDPAANVVDLIAMVLLGFVSSLEGLQLVVDVRNSLARDLESLLRGFVFLAFKSMDFDLELEFATLKLVDGLGSSLASDTYTIKSSSVCMEVLIRRGETYLAQASSTRSIAESGSRREVK